MALERLSQITESGIKNGITISNASVTGVLTASSVTVTGNSTVSGNSFVDGKLGIGTDSVSLNTLSVGSNPRGYTSYALIHNPSGVGATTRAELSDNAALIIQPHATDSIHMAFGHVNNGAGMGIQVTNYAKNADWDICLNPFGGDVGIGNTNPQSKLDVSGEIRASGIAITESYPTIRPSLNLDFTNSRSLDSRITFTRASTATYVGRDGLIKTAGVDEARFDHDPDTLESLGLLIEESGTNIHTYSIPGSNWNTNNTSLTENNTISPDGTQTATLFTGINGDSVSHWILKDHSVTTGISYTQTFFVKPGSTDLVQIACSTGWQSRYVNFQLTGDGVIGDQDVGSESCFIQKYPNGWYRIGVIQTTITTTGAGRMILTTTSSLTSSRLSASAEGTFYVWGAQIEQGSFPTSYIPTSGSTVTRSSDNASITGTNFTDFYNQTEGTFSVTAKPNEPNNGSNYYFIFEAADSSDYSNAMSVGKDNGNTYRLRPSKYSNLSDTSVAYTTNLVNIAIAGSGSGDGVAVVNGTVSATSTGTPSGTQDHNVLHIGNRFPGSSGGHYYGTIKSLKYYSKRLPNAQLQSLTRQ